MTRPPPGWRWHPRSWPRMSPRSPNSRRGPSRSSTLGSGCLRWPNGWTLRCASPANAPIISISSR
ncbi:chromosome partition protein smc [Mycobacterium tuberculosis T17]|nr:chromosome partition protein smc [Mycobacterium tuberculosis T17]